jgi:hypothetical protein
MSEEIYKGATIRHQGNGRVTVQIEGDEAVNFHKKEQAYAYVDGLEDEEDEELPDEPEPEADAPDAEIANPRKPVAPKPLKKKLAKSKTIAKAKAKPKK